MHCCFRSRHNGKKRGEDDANTGRKATKDKKWLVPSFIGVLLLAAIACVAISICVGWNLTHKERKAVVETPEAYEMAYQDVTFTSKDGGLKLKGWVIEPTKQ